MRLARSHIARALFAFLLKSLSRTWRFRNAPSTDGEPRIVAFPHGAMVPVWFHFRGGRAGCVVSRSEDGEILSHYLEALGYRQIIRGSSSTGGREVLEEMIAMVERRSCLITPDGPRGPARKAKPGAVVAAVRSGRELLLLDWSTRHAITLNSWDAMRIPYPFSGIEFRYCIIDPSQIKDIIRKTESVERRSDQSDHAESDTFGEIGSAASREVSADRANVDSDAPSLGGNESAGRTDERPDDANMPSNESDRFGKERTPDSDNGDDEAKPVAIGRSHDMKETSMPIESDRIRSADSSDGSARFESEPKRFEKLLVEKILDLVDDFMNPTNRNDSR